MHRKVPISKHFPTLTEQTKMHLENIPTQNCIAINSIKFYRQDYNLSISEIIKEFKKYSWIKIC